MKKICNILIGCTIAIVLPLIGKGQSIDEGGIRFEKGISWEQVLSKAKRENKYILLDFYATWCIPCLEMERTIYTNKQLGTLTKANFLAVKIQIDSTSLDRKEIKEWYPSAKMLKKSFSVKSLPYFVVLSSSGEAVHAFSGFTDVAGFIEILNDGQDPKRQHFSLLKLFNSKRLEYNLYPLLARQSKNIGQITQANLLARSYMKDSLEKLPERAFTSKNNLDFINDFSEILRPSDRLFKLCIDSPDILTEKSSLWKDNLIIKVITQEHISSIFGNYTIDLNLSDWNKLIRRLMLSYPERYVKVAVSKARIKYYRTTKNHSLYASALASHVTLVGQLSKLPPVQLNNWAWDIFLYSNRKAELRLALDWIEKAMLQDSDYKNSILAVGFLDTKANILYKLGRKKEAIELELLAKNVDPKRQGFPDALEKMLKGEITWGMKEF